MSLQASRKKSTIHWFLKIFFMPVSRVIRRGFWNVYRQSKGISAPYVAIYMTVWHDWAVILSFFIEYQLCLLRWLIHSNSQLVRFEPTTLISSETIVVINWNSWLKKREINFLFLPLPMASIKIGFPLHTVSSKRFPWLWISKLWFRFHSKLYNHYDNRSTSSFS